MPDRRSVAIQPIAELIKVCEGLNYFSLDHPPYHAALVDARAAIEGREPWAAEAMDVDDNTPAINETCQSCGQVIVRERTAVQVRRAGYQPFWCCSWKCVARIAEAEGK